MCNFFFFLWGQTELIDYYLNPGKQGYSPFPRTGRRAATGKTNRKVCQSPLWKAWLLYVLVSIQKLFFLEVQIIQNKTVIKYNHESSFSTPSSHTLKQPTSYTQRFNPKVRKTFLLYLNLNPHPYCRWSYSRLRIQIIK